jgi:hypothetical protein
MAIHFHKLLVVGGVVIGLDVSSLAGPRVPSSVKEANAGTFEQAPPVSSRADRTSRNTSKQLDHFNNHLVHQSLDTPQ